MSLTITNIQRFCVHDGPGIRTTIFLKGCSLKCPWCANPETINPNIQCFLDKEKCDRNIGTSKCDPECSVLKGETPNEKDSARCRAKAILQFGKVISEEEILEIITKDKVYYKDGGGITFSGGEPLLQLRNNKDLLKRIHEQYNVCIESSLSLPCDLEECQRYIDLFFVDLKTMVKEDYKNVVKGNLDVFEINIGILKQCGRMKDVVIRIPYVPDLTDKKENIDAINRFIEEYGIDDIQVFSLHNLAKPKYGSIGKEFVPNKEVDVDTLTRFKDQLVCNKTSILKI